MLDSTFPIMQLNNIFSCTTHASKMTTRFKPHTKVVLQASLKDLMSQGRAETTWVTASGLLCKAPAPEKMIVFTRWIVLCVMTPFNGPLEEESYSLSATMRFQFLVPHQVLDGLWWNFAQTSTFTSGGIKQASDFSLSAIIRSNFNSFMTEHLQN